MPPGNPARNTHHRRPISTRVLPGARRNSVALPDYWIRSACEAWRPNLEPSQEKFEAFSPLRVQARGPLPPALSLPARAVRNVRSIAPAENRSCLCLLRSYFLVQVTGNQITQVLFILQARALQ